MVYVLELYRALALFSLYFTLVWFKDLHHYTLWCDFYRDQLGKYLKIVQHGSLLTGWVGCDVAGEGGAWGQG